MSIYVIIAAFAASAAGVAIFAIWFTNKKSKDLGRAEVISEVQNAETVATRKADEILSEYRTVDDTVKRLRDGSF